MNYLSTAGILVFIPLIISNVLHMVIVRKDLFSGWAQPIHLLALGRSKTWRGILIVPSLNALLTPITAMLFGLEGQPWQEFALLGFALGLAYVLAELPNSWVKRKVGIQSGERSSRFPTLQTLIDKLDSTLGVLAVYGIWYATPMIQWLTLLTLAFCIHLCASWILVQLKVKASL